MALLKTAARLAVLGLLFACGERTAPRLVATPLSPPAARAEPVRAVLSPEFTDHVRGLRQYRTQYFAVSLAEMDVHYVDLEFERDLASALQSPESLLVINGGFWQPGGEPEGLSIDGAGQRAEYDRDLGGGVLLIANGRASLHDGETFHAESLDFSSVNFAIQAKPRLVVGGDLNIARDDERYADRTALCIPADSSMLTVVITKGSDPTSRGGPSLFEFGQDLVERGCIEALNLDGGPSTGVVYRGETGMVRVEPVRRIRLAVRFSQR